MCAIHHNFFLSRLGVRPTLSPTRDICNVSNHLFNFSLLQKPLEVVDEISFAGKYMRLHMMLLASASLLVCNVISFLLLVSFLEPSFRDIYLQF